MPATPIKPAKLAFEYMTTAGSAFAVQPSLIGEIEKLIDKVRAEIAAAQARGKFIAYMSVPVSSKSGGDFNTNIEMANHVTAAIEARFGDKLWVLNPAAYSLPKAATGDDYMAAWGDVLGGVDGKGSDFDMVYFVGPSDVWGFFGLTNIDKLGDLATWLANKAQTDPHYKSINGTPDTRQGFLRFYGLRASTVFSKGCHDEWSIFMHLNAMRTVGDDIAVYFDGRPIEPGDFDDGHHHGPKSQLR